MEEQKAEEVKKEEPKKDVPTGPKKNDVPSISVVILTRNRPTVLEKTLAHHHQLLGWKESTIYVVDSGDKESAEAVAMKFQGVNYTKRDPKYSYDENFRFALENVPGDYVWVLSDRIMIGLGTVPYALDHMIRLKPRAVIMGFGGRLVNVATNLFHGIPSEMLKTVGWHTTLCGSVIYSREIIEKAHKDEYMGSEWIHFSTLWDGICRCDKHDILVLCGSLCQGADDYFPAWLPRHTQIWTKTLLEVTEKFPKEFYSDYVKKRVVWNNGYNGSLLLESNWYYLANMDCFSIKTLKRYWPWIRRVCQMPYWRLWYIAMFVNSEVHYEKPWWMIVPEMIRDWFQSLFITPYEDKKK